MLYTQKELHQERATGGKAQPHQGQIQRRRENKASAQLSPEAWNQAAGAALARTCVASADHCFCARGSAYGHLRS